MKTNYDRIDANLDQFFGDLLNLQLHELAGKTADDIRHILGESEMLLNKCQEIVQDLLDKADDLEYDAQGNIPSEDPYL